MQRVRIGLTGLAFVFLLVMLATALVRPSNEAPLTANLIEQQKAGDGSDGNDGSAEPKEPLAELGVAPGNDDTDNKAATPAPIAPAQQR